MKKNKRKKDKQMRCPYCGASVELRSAEGIYKNNNRDTMLYVCKNYPVCDSYVRVHPGSKIPMGTMANGELRRLRHEAHKYFNQLYESGYMTKDDAYRWLAAILCTAMIVLTASGTLTVGSAIGDLAVITGCAVLTVLLALLCGNDSRAVISG